MTWKCFPRLLMRVKWLLLVAASLVLFSLDRATAETGSRYETFLFGVCYYPEQWPESYWEEDARRMKECGVTTVRIGDFGWALMEPRQGHFDFGLFERAISTMARHGFNVDAARYLMKRYAGELGLKPLLTDVPEQVEVTRRSKGGTDYYFLLNHRDTPAAVNVADGFIDAVTSDASPRDLTIAPFDYRVLKRERTK